jgi:hypothetical protein
MELKAYLAGLKPGPSGDGSGDRGSEFPGLLRLLLVRVVARVASPLRNWWIEGLAIRPMMWVTSDREDQEVQQL